MIKHIVMFKIKDDYKSEILNAKARMESMINKIEEIRALQVGIDFLHSDRSYDLVLEVLLDDEVALNKYQINEYHITTVKDFMKNISEKSITIDYELE